MPGKPAIKRSTCDFLAAYFSENKVSPLKSTEICVCEQVDGCALLCYSIKAHMKEAAGDTAYGKTLEKQ